MKLIDTIQDIITEQKGNKPLAQTIVNRRLKKAKELAVDFPNPRQFALKYKKLWHFIRHYNLIDELFPDRKKYREDYTPEEVKKLANGFAAALDFEIEHPTAFNYAVRHKMIPDLFPDRHDKMKSYATYFGNKEASPYYNKEIQKHFDHLMDRASSQYKDMDDLKKRNPELYKQLDDLGHDYVPEDITEQQTSNLTVPEQTLLGFLNRFLRGEEGEFQNTPIDQLRKTMLFNSKTIYPMAQKLLEKKNTGKKTYDEKTFNSLFMSMDKSITKEQRYEFFNEGGSITNIKYNSQF
jgi:hypothetical protein